MGLGVPVFFYSSTGVISFHQVMGVFAVIVAQRAQNRNELKHVIIISYLVH